MDTRQKKIAKPVRPENDDCCGGGSCCPCVWDAYFSQLGLWEEQQIKNLPSKINGDTEDFK